MSTARPHHCQLCERALAKDEVGFACEHFVHGSYLTYEAAKAKKGIGDTVCTACAIAYEPHQKNDETKAAEAVLARMNVHVVCARCYEAAAKRNVATRKSDRKRGYALVPRDTHAALQGMKMRRAAKLEVAGHAKLVFVPVPSRERDELEMMWVRITRIQDDRLQGTLANQPRLFPKKLLAEGAKVSFAETDVVAVAVDEG